MLAIGAFVTLAKIDAGFHIVTWACIFFTVVFLYRAVAEYREGEGTERFLTLVENLVLAALSVLYVCKAYLLLFHGLDTVYLLAVAGLAVLYVYRAFRLVRERENGTVRMVRLVFFVAVLLLLLTDIWLKVFYTLPAPLIVAGAALALAVLAYVGYQHAVHIGKKTTAPDFLDIARHRVYWFVLGLLLLFPYKLAVNYQFTDEVWFMRLPRDYVDLFYQAESGEDQPNEDGKYMYEVYKEGYDKFVEDHILE